MKIKYAIYFSLILALISIGIILIKSAKEISKKEEESKIEVSINQSLVDSVHTEILRLRLEHPTIVFSQILLETGYFTSELFMTNNNMFGMKASGSRATTSNVIVNGYKYYTNWRESLIDYALLQMAFYRGISETEYLKRLSISYASDPNYIKKIQNIQKTLK